MTDTPKHTIVEYLDATLVLVSVLLLGGVLWVLSFVHVPQENLPILASIASGIFGSGGRGYIGFRWGASPSTKKDPPATPGTVTATMTATAETTPEV